MGNYVTHLSNWMKARPTWIRSSFTVISERLERAVFLNTRSDHDALYRFHQWQANLRVLGVTETKRFLTCHFRIPFSND
jgi:hypothetical protein